MKKLFLVLLMGVSVCFAMSDKEFDESMGNCLENNDVLVCQMLIDKKELVDIEECNKDNCAIAGMVHQQAGYLKEAIKYYQKAIRLGDNNAYRFLADLYAYQKDFENERKILEITCNLPKNKINTVFKAETCYNLGFLYDKGQGVKTNYQKAAQYYKMACDLNLGQACNNLGYLYDSGQGVKYDSKIAKQYYGKACDLGKQMGCDNYKATIEQESRPKTQIIQTHNNDFYQQQMLDEMRKQTREMQYQNLLK